MRTILGMVLVGAVGCFGPTVVIDGHKLLKSEYESQLEKVRTRAGFDLNCPADKLQTTVLETAGSEQSGEARVLQFGVSGCEHRGSYVLTDSGWIMNAHNGEPSTEHAQSTR